MGSSILTVMLVGTTFKPCRFTAASITGITIGLPPRPVRLSATELLSAEGVVMPILHLGLPDAFQHHASREDLMAEVGLDAAGIRKAMLLRWPALAGTDGILRATGT